MIDLGWSAALTVLNLTENVMRGSVVKQSRVGLEVLKRKEMENAK